MGWVTALVFAVLWGILGVWALIIPGSLVFALGAVAMGIAFAVVAIRQRVRSRSAVDRTPQ